MQKIRTRDARWASDIFPPLIVLPGHNRHETAVFARLGIRGFAIASFARRLPCSEATWVTLSWHCSSTALPSELDEWKSESNSELDSSESVCWSMASSSCSALRLCRSAILYILGGCAETKAETPDARCYQCSEASKFQENQHSGPCLLH